MFDLCFSSYLNTFILLVKKLQDIYKATEFRLLTQGLQTMFS